MRKGGARNTDKLRRGGRNRDTKGRMEKINRRRKEEYKGI